MGPSDYVPREDIARALEASSSLTIVIAQEAREARTLVRGALEALEALRGDIRELDREVDAWEDTLHQVRDQLRVLEGKLEAATKQLEGIASTQAQNKAAEMGVVQTRISSDRVLWGTLATALAGLLGTLILVLSQNSQKKEEGSKGEVLDYVARSPAAVSSSASPGRQLRRL